MVCCAKFELSATIGAFFQQVSTNDRTRFDVFGSPVSAEVVSPRHLGDFGDDDDDDDDNRR